MDVVETAVAQTLPNRSVADIHTQDTRPGNVVGRVTFENGTTAYVKTATDTDRRLRREAAATRFAAAAGSVPVPTVVGADPTGSPPSLVVRPSPGTPLNDPWVAGEAREPLVRAAGRTLARIHEVRPEKSGRIVGGDETGVETTDESWSETLAATVEWRGADWFADRFDVFPGRLASLLRNAAPVLDNAAPRLLHGDFSRKNVHLDPVCVLDWERALVGDPAFDVVDARSHLIEQVDVADDERDRLVGAFHDGYRAVAGRLPAGLDRREPIYRAVAFLLVPQTFEKWAPSADEPTNELAAWVREEFDSRLAAARRVIP